MTGREDEVVVRGKRAHANLRGVVWLTIGVVPWSLHHDWSRDRLGLWSLFSALTGAVLVLLFFRSPRLAHTWLYWNALVAGPLYFLCVFVGILPRPRYEWLLGLNLVVWLSIPWTMRKWTHEHAAYMDRLERPATLEPREGSAGIRTRDGRGQS